ncbi:glutamate--cysteine ligase, partial [Streptomyces sp. NPDC056730]
MPHDRCPHCTRYAASVGRYGSLRVGIIDRDASARCRGLPTRSRRDTSMGEKVEAGGSGLSDRQKYRRKLQQCLAVLGRLLAEEGFDRPKNLMGLEIELNLAGSDGMPRI